MQFTALREFRSMVILVRSTFVHSTKTMKAAIAVLHSMLLEKLRLFLI